MIVTEILRLMEGWRPAFRQGRTHAMAVRMALATLWVLGRNTISQRIVVLRQHRGDWNKFFRLFSKRQWDNEALFNVVLEAARAFCPGRYVVVAADDTVARKTGKQIYSVGYLRDPLSPKFRYNLALGLRFVQLSLLLPLYALEAVGAACALPIRYQLAAVIRPPKGKRGLTAAEQEAYAQAKQRNTLSHYLVDIVRGLRGWMTGNGLADKVLLLVVDNGYCNRTVFGSALAGVQLLARARANYRLYASAAGEGAGFTPEEVRKDKERRWRTAGVHFGGGQQTIKYKEVPTLCWPGGSAARVLRLLVIASTPYRRRKYARMCYRQPGYLLTTDLTAPAEFLLQSYFDRWQIEVNHRDEKTVIGVGDAQVHAQSAVERAPAFAVAAYSLLKLATLRALGPTRTPDYPELPAWYAGARRPSCEDMLQKLRREACEHPELTAPWGVQLTPEGLIAACRA